MNSASNMGDLWTHDPLPRLNAAHVAEVNRLIKLENQRGSADRSTQGGQSSQQQPTARASIQASSDILYGGSPRRFEPQGPVDAGRGPIDRGLAKAPPNQQTGPDLSRYGIGESLGHVEVKTTIRLEAPLLASHRRKD